MQRKLILSFGLIAIVLLGSMAGAFGGRMLASAQPLALDGPTVKQAATAPDGLASASTTRLTYQARLLQGGSPTTAFYDFVFTLYDNPAGGNIIAEPITLTNQTVSLGLVTAELDFGAAFYGQARWLQVAVRPTNSGNYVVLAPRHQITTTPYARSAAWLGSSGKPAPFSPLRQNTTRNPLDSTGSVGSFPAVTVGSDGLPIISYYSLSGGDLKVAHCDDLACTTATISTLDSSGLVGTYTSITIGRDDLPIISYYDTTNTALKVAHCNDVTCSTATTTTLDSANDVGKYTSIAINTTGYAVISYVDDSSDQLRLARCADLACTAAATSVLDDSDIEASDTSIAVGSDGLVVISYAFVTAGSRNLKVAHCNNNACGTFTTSTVDFESATGEGNALAIGADGLPIISYFNTTNNTLRVAHCNNLTCSLSTRSVLDNVGDASNTSWIALGVDGLPVISYSTNASNEFALNFAHCSNVVCSTAANRVVDSTGSVGNGSAVTVGTDGLPIISYFDSTNDDLKVARCGSIRCTAFQRGQR